MKKFIIKSILLSFIIMAAFMLVLSRADGYTDPFYVRFTTPKQSNLIIGASRAAQGVRPDKLNEIFGKPFFNYSFTVAHSPFGPTYLNSIKKKIDSHSKNGIFIVTVEPWGICSWTDDPNDSLSFRELNFCLANTQAVNLNPNPIYLLNNWNEKYFNILTKRDTRSFLHQDGWLEINVDMDTVRVNNRTKDGQKVYKENYLIKAKYSNLRLRYLIKTIEFLQMHGKVYLVRLPMHTKIMDIENELMPDFNEKIQNAINLSSGYLDLTKNNDDFIYTDGSHLYKESAKEVSKMIGNWILEEGKLK